MDAVTAIRERRSVRRYRPDPVPEATLRELVAAACWAPSGLNNQPWRFYIVTDAAKREALAGCTRYGRVLRGAPAAIAVLLDNTATYHRDKDCQAIGAAIQNLLLAATAAGLGTCWLGEILNRRQEVEQILGTPAELELMAVVTVGHPIPGEHGKADRLPLERVLVGHD